ncbi:MAG: hypothetical protein AAGL90_11820 [Pseudomonadota bacterium]
MWYLWLQILFLLALAALCGAGLAYWWLRGRYEDVTETYSSLISSTKPAPDLMERSDLDARLLELSEKIDRLENADLSPLEAQILGLANELPDAQPELSPLLSEIQAASDRSEAYSQSIDERLAAIEANAKDGDLEQDRFDAMASRLDGLETRLSDAISQSIGPLHNAMNDKPDIDLGPMLTRLDEMRAQVDQLSALPTQVGVLSKQATELSESQDVAMKSEIARLDQRFASLSDGMLRPMQQNLQSIASKTPESEGQTRRLEDRLQALEEQMARTQNLVRPLREKLDQITPGASANAGNHRALANLDQKLIGFDETIAAIKQRMDQIGSLVTALDRRVDLTSVDAKLDRTVGDVAALRSSMPTLASLEPLEQNLARLQQMVFNLRERDVATLNNAIRSIEGRVDFVGVENRLTSIEYGLAATHHMLRSRLEHNVEIPPAPQREPFREPPKDYAFAPQSSLRTPEAPLDPINMIRTEDATSNLLLEPGFGQADNLEKIRGIGPMLRQLLNDTGVFYYWQIAEWGAEDVMSVDALLPGYQGRITRDRWVEQAQELASLPGAAERPKPFGG